MYKSSLNQVFKFMQLRPPIEADKEHIISLEDTAFGKKLSKALDADRPKKKLFDEAKEFAKGPQFISDLSQLEFAEKILQLIEKLEEANPKKRKNWETIIKDIFEDVSSLSNDQRFINDLTKLSDSLLTIKYGGNQNNNPELLEKAFKVLHTVRELEIDQKYQPDYKEVTKKAILLPWADKHLKDKSDRGPNTDDGENETPTEKFEKEVGKLIKARDELRLKSKPQNIKFSSHQVIDEKKATPTGERDGIFQQALRWLGLSKIESHSPLPISSGPVETPFTLKEEIAASLSSDTKEVIKNLDIDLSTTSAYTAINNVSSSIGAYAAAPAKGHSFTYNNGALVKVYRPSDFGAIGSEGFLGDTIFYPAGIGELLVVKQQIKCYEGGK